MRFTRSRIPARRGGPARPRAAVQAGPSLFDFEEFAEVEFEDPPSTPDLAPAVTIPAMQGTLDGLTPPVQYVPSGFRARFEANIAAITTWQAVQAADRPATPDERKILRAWSGWGAISEVFDKRAKFRERHADDRARLAALLTEQQFAAAELTTLNAHYTDPVIVQAMWQIAAQLGFPGGPVLEPGSGSGNFIAAAPAGAQMTGVELDPVTAGISQALYPCAQILNAAIEDIRIGEGTFNLVIGNVPFGKLVPVDPVYNRDRHSLHNLCLIKGLHLLRPGGLLIAITSGFTMDAETTKSRAAIAGLADLIGAVRLPSDAHQRTAGTKVGTDIVAFRRRLPGALPAGEPWLGTRPVTLDGNKVRVSEYFLDRPGRVLGTMHGKGGAYGRTQLTVKSSGDLAAQLPAVLASIACAASEQGLRYAADDAGTAGPVTLALDDTEEGNIACGRYTGTFTQVTRGRVTDLKVPASQARELADLVGLKTAARGVLAAEAADAEDTPGLAMLRARMASLYDEYLRTYGPVNRFVSRNTGRKNEETGEPEMAKVRPAVFRIFRTDPYYPLVLALEEFDEETQTAIPAAIQTRRITGPPVVADRAETPAEAVALCLDQHGRIDLSVIARLLGVDQAEARDVLGREVFDDPAAGDLVPAAEYLSGNVRAKLRAAEEAEKEDPGYRVNVEALREVQPVPLTPAQITARMGAVWIPVEVHRDFLRDILDDRYLRVDHGGGSYWEVTGDKTTIKARTAWGTDRFAAPDLAKAILEQRAIEVRDPHPTEKDKYVLNPEATLAANAKADEMRERFAEWIWEDPDRARELAVTYNDVFNNLVLRTYKGTRLTFPGLTLGFDPHSHQHEAVAMGLYEPAALYAHDVGAGKTAELIMTAMKKRQLGMCRKPCLVVPNHLLEDFAREWVRLYPQAKVLIAYKPDMAGEKRHTFVARCATGDWDGIIITQSAFTRIRLEPRHQEEYLAVETALLESWIEENGSSRTVKRMQLALKRARDRIKSKIAAERKDRGVCWEETGCDLVLMDEAHGVKNLRTPSHISDASIAGSQKATDFDMKLWWTRRTHGNGPILATATPVANAIAEVWVMLKYLRPDLLLDAGFEVFDQWAATFCELVTRIELAPEGGGSFRPRTRLGRFRNLPELLRMLHVAADVRTQAELGLIVPLIALDGEGRRTPVTVVVPPSMGQEAYIHDVGLRADAIRAGHPQEYETGEADDWGQPVKGVDNMLRISTHGRMCGLDGRMVGMPQDTPGKIEYAARKIHGIWVVHAGDVFPGADGEGEHPIRGALQLVFCDLGTPTGKSWNAYQALKDELVALGMPADSVRFIHEAATDQAKTALYWAARNGAVSVLMGSTEKMGTGMNVQFRCIAQHDLDAPWRPADVAQRLGRSIRFGNHYKEVQLFRYVTEGSFDAYMWQTLSFKAEFIAKIMRRDLDIRDVDDIGDAALSFNEVKALTTGNTLLLDKAEADAALVKLERGWRAHQRTQALLAHEIEHQGRHIPWLQERAATYQEAITRRIDTRGDLFRMTVDGGGYSKRDDAGEAFHDLVMAEAPYVSRGERRVINAGTLGGLAVQVVVTNRDGWPWINIQLADAPRDFEMSFKRFQESGRGHYLITRIEHLLAGLDTALDDTRHMIGKAEKQMVDARASLGAVYPKTDELAAARDRAAGINAELARLAAPATPPGDGGSQPADPVVTAAEARVIAETRRRSLPATVAPHILLILRDDARTEGHRLYLNRPLSRRDYEQVNRLLEAAGGKWETGLQAHWFHDPAADALEQIHAHYSQSGTTIAA